MKNLAEIRRILKGPEYVGEILDGEIKAVAGVDRPATGRRWRFFKGIDPTLAPGLPNYGECFERHLTPTACENAPDDDPFDRREVLAADMAGHDATMLDAKMLEDVDEAIARGELKGAFKMTPTRGAKCPGPDAKEVPPPPGEEMLEGDVPMEGEPEAIEIPATPTEWTLADCLTQAQEMGLPEDAAVSACQMVRTEFGDVNDEAKILVPEGTETEGLINAAAMSLGYGKSLKADVAKPPKGFKFSGQNHWRRLFNKFLGRAQRPGANLVKYLQGVEARLEDLTMHGEKASADLRLMIEQQGRIISQQGDIIRSMAGFAGVTLPEPAPLATPEAPAPAEVVAPAAPAAPSNPIYGEPAKSAPAEGAKDGAPAGAPIVPPTTDADRLARLEQAFELLLAQLNGSDLPDPDAEEEDLVGAVPAAAPPAKRVSVPTPEGNRLRFKAEGAPSAQGLEHSTILGVSVSAAERAAQRNGGGGPRRFGRK